MSLELTEDQVRALKVDRNWLPLKILSACVIATYLTDRDIPDCCGMGGKSGLAFECLPRWLRKCFPHFNVILEVGHGGRTGLVKCFLSNVGLYMTAYTGDRESYESQYVFKQPVTLRAAFDYIWSFRGQKYQYFSYNCIRFAFDLLVHLGVVTPGFRSFWHFYYENSKTVHMSRVP